MVRNLPIGAGGLLSYFTRHKTVANLLLVVLVVSGLLTLPNMRAQFFPDVIVDKVSVVGNQDYNEVVVNINYAVANTGIEDELNLSFQ